MEECKEMIQYEALRGYHYKPCLRKAKYKVTFLKSTNGKETTKYLCGVHLTALRKNAKRIKEKTGWDSKIEAHTLPIINLNK